MIQYEKIRDLYRPYGIRVIGKAQNGHWRVTAEDPWLNRRYYPVIQFDRINNLQDNVDYFWKTFPKQVQKIIQKFQRKEPDAKEYEEALDQWERVFGASEKLIQAALDEIYASIEVTYRQNHCCGVGNYWLGPKHNIFCETYQDMPDTIPYYVIKLEEYDGEECTDTEVVITDTESLSKEELEKGIRRLVYQAIHIDGDLLNAVSEKSWKVTDSDCAQCLRILSMPMRTYELVQVNDYTDIEGGFRVANGIIRLDQYSEREVEQIINFYGYRDMRDFEVQNNGLDWSLIAEMAFEIDAAGYEIDGYKAESYSEAVKKVKEITGLDVLGELQDQNPAEKKKFMKLDEAKNQVNHQIIMNLRDRRYFLCGVLEGAEDLNDANRRAILSMQAAYGGVYLGKINPKENEKFGGIELYTDQRLYNFCCDFCIPAPDRIVIDLIQKWNTTPNLRVLHAIYNRIEELNGIVFVWS